MLPETMISEFKDLRDCSYGLVGFEERDKSERLSH